MQGEKTYIKFSSAMHGEVDYLDQNGLTRAHNDDMNSPAVHHPPLHTFLSTTPSPSKVYDDEASRATPNVPNGSLKPPSTPLRIEKLQNQMSLIGKASPVTESAVKSSSFVKSSAPPSRAQKLPPQPKEEATAEEMVPGPSRLAVNIPVADMVSASSAAVNSIADFQEFGMDGGERCADITEHDSQERSL